MGLISRVSSRTYRNQKSKNPTHTMIIPTDDRLKIWRTLFQEGVMIAAKDTRSTHADTKVRNLYVMKALQSLKSKGLVKENYLATLSLGLDRRRYHLPPRTTQSPRKRYAKHLETNPRTTGPTRPTTKQSRRRTTSLRKPRRLPTKPRRWCR